MNTKVTYSEQELVALLQQRNEYSFGYLYDNYSGALLGVISAIVSELETARMYCRKFSSTSGERSNPMIRQKEDFLPG